MLNKRSCSQQKKIHMKRAAWFAVLTLFVGVISAAAQRPSLNLTPQMELQLTGQTGIYHRIESSTNLTDWVPQRSFFLLSAVSYTRVVGGAGDMQEFFRAVALPSDWLVMNNSYPDPCAEHDNVNVVFRITNFWIIATHPTNYAVVDYSNCRENWTNCPASTNVDFKFPYSYWTMSYGGYRGWAHACRDLSWRPQGMTVTLDGLLLAGNDSTNITRVDIGKEIPGGGGEAPGYFSFYPDGYFRVIPFPPVGHPDVCMGMSVLIGPAAVAERPYADIESVDIRSESQTLFVTYRTGGSATIDFSDVTRTRAIIKVAVNYPTTNSTCTVRSQFASVGNSDCDTVTWTDSVGIVHSDPIMSFLGTSGANFFFNRQFGSIQRESAPDTLIVLQ
jgi:hypothetical protein